MTELSADGWLDRSEAVGSRPATGRRWVSTQLQGLWQMNSARVAGVHAPAKPVCGRHVVGTVVL